MEKLVYRISEAAEALGFSRSKTYALVAEGRLPVVYIGRSVRIPVDALKELIAGAVTTKKRETAANLRALDKHIAALIAKRDGLKAALDGDAESVQTTVP